MNQETLHFKNHEDESLAATLHLPNVPNETGVVLGHCFTCSRHTRVLRAAGAALAQQGIMALRFDFSGNGQSQGLFAESTFTKQIKEMQAAITILKARGATRIGLAGHSMGASVSVLTGANTDNIKAVCAISGRLTGSKPELFLTAEQQSQFSQNGATTFSSRGRELQLTQTFVDNVKSFDLPSVIKEYALPLLVIHGGEDEIIPVETAYTAQAFNSAKIRLEVISGGDHMFSQAAHKKLVVEKITQWFQEKLT